MLYEKYSKIVETVISKYKENISFVVYIDKTRHADERQWRHGVSDYITDDDIINVVRKATSFISKQLVFDKLDIGDEIVIYDRTNDLNIVCSLEASRDDIINIVIITVMKKRDFKPKSGTKKIII